MSVEPHVAAQAMAAPFPRTRYQGSKYRLAPWLGQCFAELGFDTALDVFGGTACVSHLLKGMGKAVTYNDVLRFNWHVGVALVANSSTRLDDVDVDSVLRRREGVAYDDLIARTFRGVYYLDDENAWLDVVVQNVLALPSDEKRSLALWALFQACLAKRPYNLFHRKNLYVRTSSVERSFGNKVTWDRAFEEHFRRFVSQGNAAVFDNGRDNRALCLDAAEVPGAFDLVYVDPPYLPARGSVTDYFGFYHFLEGLVGYRDWESRIDVTSKHLRLRDEPSPWCDRQRIAEAFDTLFERFADSLLVVSYRDDGVPSIAELEGLLRRHGRQVRSRSCAHQYALSTKRQVREVLLVAERCG